MYKEIFAILTAASTLIGGGVGAGSDGGRAAGAPAARIHAVSYGKERPAAVGAKEDSWSRHRRAVTVAEWRTAPPAP